MVRKKVKSIDWGSSAPCNKYPARSVLALKMGQFRSVKYSPIFESSLAPLNQGQYSPIT